ncbi:MAG: endolytic transglycosylase MltG, partial [Firmicutes bacterium]|nr:endolytic transglycosylase MltG [Bacillota bacterium]
PIAAPGLASIEAALYPADVDYFFFVAKEDGTGEHYFSRTLEEHNSYKLKVQQNR